MVIGDHRAASDLAGLAVKRQPRKDPAAPDRKPHLSFDPPPHLRPGDGEAGVGCGLAGHRHLGPESHGLARCGQFDQELGPLVFLYLHADAAGVTSRLGREHPAAGQRAGRNRQGALEGADGIGRVLTAGHLAAIGIAERNGDVAVCEGPIVAAALIGRADDPLIKDDLAGTVDATVGDQHDRRAAAGFLLRPDMRRVGRDRVRLAVECGGGDEHDFAALLGLELIAAVAIGRGRTTLGKRLRVAALLADPGRHAGSSHGLSGGEIDDMAGERAARLRDNRQPRHPHERSAHHVVVATEVGLVAGDQPIGPRLEPLRIEGLRNREIVAS